jgi:hypothetical protein
MCTGPLGCAVDIKGTEEVAGQSLLPKSIIDLWDKLFKRLLLVNNKVECRRSQEGKAT